MDADLLKRIERFNHPVLKELYEEKSYIPESPDVALKDPQYIMGGLFELLAKLNDGNLIHFLGEAKKELKKIKGTLNNSAWDDMISYLPDLIAQETENRLNLTKKYRGTNMWEHVTSYFEYIDVGTTAVFRAAVRLYTTNSVYTYLNNCFRNRESLKIKGYSTLLRNALKSVPYFTGTKVYRGTTIEDYTSYENGLVYRWPAFVSASANEEQAKKFGPVLFVINIPPQFYISDVSRYSIYPEESEVLFHPYARFEVIEKKSKRIDITICTKGTVADWM